MIEDYKCPICKHCFDSCNNVYHLGCKLITYCKCEDIFFSYSCRDQTLSLYCPIKFGFYKNSIFLNFKNNTTVIAFSDNYIQLDFLIDSKIFNSIEKLNNFFDNIYNYI